MLFVVVPEGGKQYAPMDELQMPSISTIALATACGSVNQRIRIIAPINMPTMTKPTPAGLGWTSVRTSAAARACSNSFQPR